MVITLPPFSTADVPAALREHSENRLDPDEDDPLRHKLACMACRMVRYPAALGAAAVSNVLSPFRAGPEPAPSLADVVADPAVLDCLPGDALLPPLDELREAAA
jgi:hypothetical protein